jgi:hypothetical protein
MRTVRRDGRRPAFPVHPHRGDAERVERGFDGAGDSPVVAGRGRSIKASCGLGAHRGAEAFERLADPGDLRQQGLPFGNLGAGPAHLGPGAGGGYQQGQASQGGTRSGHHGR